jgi:hypothetical protein
MEFSTAMIEGQLLLGLVPGAMAGRTVALVLDTLNTAGASHPATVA